MRLPGNWPAVLAWTLGLILTSCSKSPDHERDQFSPDDTAVVVAGDVEILYSDSAVVRVRITAPVLRDFSERDNPRQEFPNGVKVEFLDAVQAVSSTLTARQGVRFQEKGQIHVRDSVVLTTAKQEKLETEELIWDEKSEKVFTEKFVKVTKPGEVIYGYGLEANQDFSYWKITVPKGRIKVDPLNDALD